MSDNAVDKVFEVLSIRIRAEIRYALDAMDAASSTEAKIEACNALSAAVWNWEAFNTIWDLAQGDEEVSPLGLVDARLSEHLERA